MSIVVDRYELGPIGTNCYVVRRAKSAEKAVVIDPSGDAGQLRLELAALGAKCAAILTAPRWRRADRGATVAQVRRIP